MTAKIIQLRDFQNPKDLARMYSEATLEQQAVQIMNVALIGPGGIDDLVYETSLGFVEPYVAPSDDCA